jgi:uncharacterized protein with GYD domain
MMAVDETPRRIDVVKSQAEELGAEVKVVV